MNDLFNEMERLIYLSFMQKAYLNVSTGYWSPPTDVYETADSIIVYVEIAGVKKSDISITYKNNCLLISGERKKFFPKYTNMLNRMEIESGKFFKKLRINIKINEEDIQAEYHDGILEITLPKS